MGPALACPRDTERSQGHGRAGCVCRASRLPPCQPCVLRSLLGAEDSSSAYKVCTWSPLGPALPASALYRVLQASCCSCQTLAPTSVVPLSPRGPQGVRGSPTHLATAWYPVTRQLEVPGWGKRVPGAGGFAQPDQPRQVATAKDTMGLPEGPGSPGDAGPSAAACPGVPSGLRLGAHVSEGQCPAQSSAEGADS